MVPPLLNILYGEVGSEIKFGIKVPGFHRHIYLCIYIYIVIKLYNIIHVYVLRDAACMLHIYVVAMHPPIHRWVVLGNHRSHGSLTQPALFRSKLSAQNGFKVSLSIKIGTKNFWPRSYKKSYPSIHPSIYYESIHICPSIHPSFNISMYPSLSLSLSLQRHLGSSAAGLTWSDYLSIASYLSYLVTYFSLSICLSTKWFYTSWFIHLCICFYNSASKNFKRPFWLPNFASSIAVLRF